MAEAPGISRCKLFMEEIEVAIEKWFKRSQKPLLFAARLFLASTFISDGYRMSTYWKYERMYFSANGEVFLALLYFMNVICQLGGSLCIITKTYSTPAVFVLFAVLAFQIYAYQMTWVGKICARAVSLTGALLLLLADSRVVSKEGLVGLPSLGNKDIIKAYMQLAGRILVTMMVFNLIKPEMSTFETLYTGMEIILMLLVAMGYRTKLAASILVVILFIGNCYANNFLFAQQYQSHALRHYFFQTLAVIGGLLMIVVLGAGDISIDNRKKEF